MCVDCCRNPFHCIVPPHMLRVLEMRGDARQTEMARALLSQGRDGARRAGALTATPMLRTRGAADAFEAPAFAVAAPERHLNREIYTGEEQATLPGTLVRSEGGDAVRRRRRGRRLRRGGRGLRLLLRHLRARFDRRPGDEARRDRPPPPQVQQRLLGRHADGLRRRGRADLLDLHRDHGDRPRDEPRRGAVLGRARVPGPVGRAQRELRRRLRLDDAPVRREDRTSMRATG